ncbi:CCA tRNA nucleotidyltransferase, partial [Planococcus sp. SIMBA_143]
DIPLEVTTFRTESGYSDFPRPDQVSFTNQLNSDLERRDFTMNAMAMDENFEILDPYGGMKDIEERVIRTVGCPEERCNEDALRMLRAARFAAHLDFPVDPGADHAQAPHTQTRDNAAMARRVQAPLKPHPAPRA